MNPTVVVTGTGGTLARELEQLGADVIEVEVVSIQPPEDSRPLLQALSLRGRFDFLVVTSRNGASALVGSDGWPGFLEQEIPRLKVVAVGSVTASALRHAGARVDVVPTGKGAQGILAELAGQLAGASVLWPRSDRALPQLRDGLQSQGATVVDPIAYRTTSVDSADSSGLRTRLEAGTVDALTFMSPSAALATDEIVGGLRRFEQKVRIASIGPTTSHKLRELGVAPAIEPKESTAAALARAVMQSYQEVSP